MATDTHQLDMSKINSGIKNALALNGNEAVCAALEPIAERLIEGYIRYNRHEYVAPALVVIEQMAARDPCHVGLGRGVIPLYKRLYQIHYARDTSNTLIHESALRSLGHLCASDPSAWPLKGISGLISVIVNQSVLRGCHDVNFQNIRDHDNNEKKKLCHLAVEIAKISAKEKDPQLEDRANLYAIAASIPVADGLLATAARLAHDEAKQAIGDGSVDILGISALLCTSIQLFQSSVHRNEPNADPISISQTVDFYFEKLERWRAQHTEGQAQFGPENPSDNRIRRDLESSYRFFGALDHLHHQHAAQQNHAIDMVDWLKCGGRGEAPATAWSIAQENSWPSLTSVFERLRQLREGGGAANGNTPQAKRPSSYAFS